MRLPRCISLMFLLATSCGPDSSVGIESGSAAVGQWRHFYSRDFTEARRLDYFYDQSRVHRNRGHVVSRWKVVGSPTETTTLYVIDISCRDGTFTEIETVMVDAEGRARKLTQPERYAARTIESGTSSDVFRRAFCR